MKNRHVIILILIVILVSCLNEQESAVFILRKYIEKKEKQFRHQEKKESLLFWQASLSGDRADYNKLSDLAVDFQYNKEVKDQSFQIDKFKKLDQKLFSDKEDLDFLRKMKDSELIKDSILARQLDIIYLKILGGEFDQDKYRKLVELEMEILHHIQNSMPEIDGVRYSDNQIDSIRKITVDPLFFKEVFNARRELAREMVGKCIDLINLRNDFSQDCGYANYYEFVLASYEIKPSEVDRIIHELDTITEGSYNQAKKVLDKFLMKRFGIEKKDIMPWHYIAERNIFIPTAFSKSMDELLEDKDVVELTASFFDELTLGLDNVLDASLINSPLVKSQLNYFINIDQGKDMRIMANVKNNLHGLKEIMFLCSQAICFKYVNNELPNSVVYPNPVISKGVGGYFMNDIINYEWLNEFVGIEDDDTLKMKMVCRHAYQIEKILIARYSLAMAVFERELYRDPNQDLGKLWWDIRTRYLKQNRPQDIYECDWALSDHLFLVPGATQTNIFAELFAAQLKSSIDSSYNEMILDSLEMTKNEFVGQFLKKNIYKYGNVLPWNALIEKATGEQLTATYYFKSIVNL